MEQQKALSLSLVRLEGEPRYKHTIRQRIFNKPSGQQSPEKLLADLLKRLARRVMADITECPPDTLPAHLARLDDLRELFGHFIRNDYKGTPESRASGVQLMHPVTLHDFAACLDITRQQHRAPSFVNDRDAELSAIHHKLDLLAGLFANSKAFQAVLNEETEQ